MGVFGTTTDTEGGSWRAHINRSHGRPGRPGPASRYSAGPALVRSPALGIPDRCAGHSEVGNGILLPTKKAGHHSPAFFVPTAATTSPDQRPPPISTPPQLCSAERIAEPTNALPSQPTHFRAVTPLAFIGRPRGRRSSPPPQESSVRTTRTPQRARNRPTANHHATPPGTRSTTWPSTRTRLVASPGTG